MTPFDGDIITGNPLGGRIKSCAKDVLLSVELRVPRGYLATLPHKIMTSPEVTFRLIRG